LSLLVAYLLIAAMHSHTTIFARWCQCAHPFSARFLGLGPLTTPNGSSVGSAAFAGLMPHSPYTLNCAAIFSPKFASSSGDLEPHLLHGSWTHPTTPMPSELTRPVFQNSWNYQWTDDASQLVRTGCLCYSATWPNNDNNSNSNNNLNLGVEEILNWKCGDDVYDSDSKFVFIS